MTSIKTLYKKNFDILISELLDKTTLFKIYSEQSKYSLNKLKYQKNYTNMTYEEVAKEEFKLYKKLSIKDIAKNSFGIEYVNELNEYYNDVDWESFILFHYSYIYQIKYKNNL